jgi:type VI secretion system secreted protein VgrG
MSVKDIVLKVFSDAGFENHEYKAKAGTKPRDYCVQYNETDLAFVSRLLEEEGIAYWWDHSEKSHDLILGDEPQQCSAPIGAALELIIKEGRRSSIKSGDRWKRVAFIDTWAAREQVRSAKWAVSDFTFEDPDNPVFAESPVAGPRLKTLDLFEYPAIHSDKQGGDERAKLRAEIEEAAKMRFSGSGSCLEFGAGVRFDFEGHANEQFEGEYLLTSVRHHLEQAIDKGGGLEYYNQFTCIPGKTMYRSPLRTPRPRVAGVQTAIVAGGKDGEIKVDEHGRVKVHFHWDREGKRSSDASSCWVRVSQSHAGGGFGSSFWPRVGEEVVVSFEEGNPDRPIITGRLYNAKNKPPHELPTHATRSTFQSRSHTQGDAKFNEIRFEDKDGNEHLFIRAQKDRHDYVQENAYLLIDGEQHTVVAKDLKHEVKGKLSSTVTKDHHTKVSADYALQASTVSIKADTTLVLEAGSKLSLKVGGNYVDISPGTLAINGTMVNINSGGSAGSAKAASPDSPKKADKE